MNRHSRYTDSATNSKESGSAMVVAVLVLAVLTGLGAVVFTVGFNNLQNASRDRLAEGAQGVSEAGVAQAISYVRSNGIGQLKCRPADPSTCNSLWGMNNPQTVTVTVSGGNQRVYRTWVEEVQKFSPSLGFKTGTYRIHSEGTTVPRPGKRLVQVTVRVRPIEFPIGLFGNTFANPGTAQVRHESMFSLDCINKRNLLTFEGVDQYHKLPSAAYSTKWITESTNTCSATDPKNIHAPPPPVSNPGACNLGPAPNFPYKFDRDRLGSDPLEAECADPVYPDFDSNYLDDPNDLTTWGYDPGKPRGLSDAEYKALKAKAQEQGYYATRIGKCGPNESPPLCWKPPDPAQHPNAVMYFDLFTAGSQDTVNLQSNDIVGYEGFAGGTSGPWCGQRSLIIVVRDGNLTVNSGVNLIAAIFVPDGSPDGQYHGVGGAKIIGTLFANVVDLNGDHTFTLKGQAPNTEDCFFENMPGGLIDVTPTRFHEVDR